jgi:mannosylglycoprotein endo-beta-mannosidase
MVHFRIQKLLFSSLSILSFVIWNSTVIAQQRSELNSGWQCKNATEIKVNGIELSDPSFNLDDWQNAVVPGTVLTTMLENGQIPDPFYGMNNKKIPDIYHVGSDYYTYWFVKDFDKYKLNKQEQLWLHFRGINYGCEIFLNGQKLNDEIHKGMFLRQTYNVTGLIRQNKPNRLAVIVYPPDPVGNPNGGQGGDGTIGRNVAHQYVAGWDWIQPVRDRNTGIWDKVWLEKTGPINLKNPHVVTRVPGKRVPGAQQDPVYIRTSAELQNPTGNLIKGELKIEIGGQQSSVLVEIPPNSHKQFDIPQLIFENPVLWWPNGYGEQHLYDAQVQFLMNGVIIDAEAVKVGIREIRQTWNERTRSTQFLVNGQRIFIKGGNWIISDAMLRFSPERYDAEIRFHRDMNLNMIRIWGGAITERPEFYSACDRYGLLVMQDFWMSGDCNGRWFDPKKLDDQWTRRQYPDDHGLFIESASDMIRMIRNHASLAVWCGGNEITPPENILVALTDSILSALDGTRKFITYSNSDSMSYNFLGGNGDGPYGIQPLERFWQERTFPFNSEVGSVGTGDIASLKRFIPDENLIYPKNRREVDSVWRYHKYIGYSDFIDPYGTPEDVEEFTEIIQLLNYNQYRALSEGFIAHMWDWYTGYMIWKTQNPWTSLRGQMYDYYLDPNAGLYGLNKGNESVHVMCNPADGMVMVANHTFDNQRDLMLKVQAYDNEGNETLMTQVFVYMKPGSVKKILSVNRLVNKIGSEEGCFIRLQLIKNEDDVISENLYWFPNKEGKFTGLQVYKQPDIQVTCDQIDDDKIEISIKNPQGNPVSFFNRISLVNSETKERVLPVFYSDNYISIPPGEEKSVWLDHNFDFNKSYLIAVKAWNADEYYYKIK